MSRLGSTDNKGIRLEDPEDPEDPDEDPQLKILNVRLPLMCDTVASLAVRLLGACAAGYWTNARPLGTHRPTLDER